jgi:hypothetical protein
MEPDIFVLDHESEWNEGAMLEEYKGVISIVAAQKSNKDDGIIYKKWGFPQNKDKEPISKAIPWKVRLGSKRQAVQTLKYFLEQLTNEPQAGPGSEPDDIPF